MLKIIDKIDLGHSVVAVGHHTGQYEIQESVLHKDEHELLMGLSPRKRTEWLASRDLLYQIAGLPERVQCLYDDFGKPYLKDVDKFISVSHSALWCAAMISELPCGVDIQVYTDTVTRISDRFLTPDDMVKADKHTNPIAFMHVLWGAKECLYKAYGKRKIGFKEHIFIPFLDWESNKGSGEIIYEDIHLSYDIQFRLLPEAAWVYCFERPGSTSSTNWKL